MPVNVPAEVAANLESREMDAPLYLMKVYDAQTTIRIVSDYTAIVGPDGATYDPFPFEVTPPTSTGEESPVLKVVVADVALTVVDDIIRSAGTRDPIKADVFVVQRGVLQPGGSRHVAFVSYVGFEMVNAANDRTTLSFDLMPRNYLDGPLTKYWFGPGDFPGLF